MKKSLKKTFYIGCFCLLNLPSLFAQEEAPKLTQTTKPKVALVLSGGGAKGIAHIPLLEALDSLGIVPDLVVGTSMGAIVGGLYSIGYSGDTIASIAHMANWSELLGGDISLKDVSMEEKSEFKRHLVDFDIVEGKPKVNSGLLKDQKLREFISSLAYPAVRIDDFDELAIPYRAMTTDIVNGKEYLFDKGSIALAMRASMSIPGVFEPVPYQNTLLVDGGVVNNFPVDVAQKWGADIIIGSDVSGGMQPKAKLNSIPALIFQAGMLTSNLKNPIQRDNCDILVDHMPHLTYSTGDFEKSDEIYVQGKKAVDSLMTQLVKLSKQLSSYNQREHRLPDVPNSFVLDTIIFDSITEANHEFVKARTGIKPGVEYKTEEIIDGIDRAMGTNLFRQITYQGRMIDDKQGLVLRGDEHSRNRIKGSLHYDSYRNVGLMLNYTGRNIIGKASRLLVTVDIATQPRIRGQYQKIFGKNMDWWWRSELLGEFLEQKFYLQGEIADNMNSRYAHFNNQINKNINSLNSYVGLDLTYEYTNIAPKVDPNINNNILNLRSYRFDNYEIGGHYLYSKLDQVFFPKKGLYMRGFLSRSVKHDVNLKYSVDEFEDVISSTNGFTKFGFDIEKRFDFSPKVSGIIGSNLAFILEDDRSRNEVSFTDYGYAAKYSLGGIVTAPRRGTYVFPGLHEDELFVNQVMNVNLALQLNPAKKVYVIPHVNFASVGFTDLPDYFEDAFTPSGRWSEGFETSAIISAGSTFAYNSFLGPITFDVSYVNDINKFRAFFSLGLLFNRSN